MPSGCRSPACRTCERTGNVLLAVHAQRPVAAAGGDKGTVARGPGNARHAIPRTGQQPVPPRHHPQRIALLSGEIAPAGPVPARPCPSGSRPSATAGRWACSAPARRPDRSGRCRPRRPARPATAAPSPGPPPARPRPRTRLRWGQGRASPWLTAADARWPLPACPGLVAELALPFAVEAGILQLLLEIGLGPVVEDHAMPFKLAAQRAVHRLDIGALLDGLGVEMLGHDRFRRRECRATSGHWPATRSRPTCAASSRRISALPTA